MKRLAFAAALGLALLFAADAALACACCPRAAQRLVEERTLNPTILAELARLRFAPKARLRHDEIVKGFEEEQDLTLAVSRREDRITFAFRDAKGRAGTLGLVQPRTLSVFEVDPRDTEGTGFGPPLDLYKEWTLTTAVAGDGFFRDNAGPGRRITLILHGRGNSCTMAGDFKRWTLIVRGPGAESYTLFGELEPPP